ncbi:MAG: 16S rRNA (adenine(1518)-N(6)/adenine(1519)-N(6))-dimethyltransferase RsmA [Eubacteriales bacterium]
MYKLTSPKKIDEIIKRHQFYVNKKYGQNFLTDANIIEKILEGAGITQDDDVLEIGPGIGTLTQYLCERARHVLAVEIDKNLIPILQETLQEYTNITLINKDILKMNLYEEITEIFNNKCKVIANLPYYITSEIIMRLLEQNLPVDSITVMVQKEVAQRMIASPGKKDYGSLSVAVQYYSQPEIVAIVPNTVFMPQPKVDSAVIHLKILNKPIVEVDKYIFFKVVRAAFATRRKTLLNCLSSGLSMEKEKMEALLLESNIDPKRRGETLSLDEFAQITNLIDSF